MALQLPEKDRSGNLAKLPEWTAILTIITILAFSNSVCEIALGLVLQTRLTSYFLPIDYVNITPVWAAQYFGLTGLVIAIVFGYAALGRMSSIDFRLGEFLLGDFWLKIPLKNRGYVIFGFGAFCLLALLCLKRFFWPPFPNHIWVFGATSFLCVVMTYFICTWAAAFSTVLNTITRKALVFSFVMSIVFATCHGAILEPFYLLYEPVSRSLLNPIRIVTLFSKEKSSMTLIGISYLLLPTNSSLRSPTGKLSRSRRPPLKKSDQVTFRGLDCTGVVQFSPPRGGPG